MDQARHLVPKHQCQRRSARPELHILDTISFLAATNTRRTTLHPFLSQMPQPFRLLQVQRNAASHSCAQARETQLTRLPDKGHPHAHAKHNLHQEMPPRIPTVQRRCLKAIHTLMCTEDPDAQKTWTQFLRHSHRAHGPRPRPQNLHQDC